MARGDEATSEAKRAEARELALRGDAAFGSGRCDKAISLWQQADQRFHAPTLVLRIARCEALLGRVVAATAKLESIVAEPRRPDDPAPWIEATEAATRELPSVKARIAGLGVEVGPKEAASDARAELDDRLIDTAGETPVDPGRRQLRVSAKGARWEQPIDIDEGEHRVVRLSVLAEPSRPPPQTQRRVGYALVGGGLVVAAAGVVAFGIPALGIAQSLEPVCGSTRKDCPAERQGDVDALNRNALLADLGVGIGAALGVAGAVVLLTSPKVVAEPPRFRVVPLPMGAAVTGGF